jgi:hypothetical protein
MANNPSSARVSRASASYARALFQLPNVVAVGVGRKSVQGIQTDELCVKSFVIRKVPPHQLPQNSLVPRSLVLDGEEVKTDVDVMLSPAAPPWLVHPQEHFWTALIGNKRRFRPFGGGASISSFRSPVGTVSSAVFDSRGGMAVLSCNHVLDALNHGLFGDPILQPAVDDLGTILLDTCGFLERWVPVQFGAAGRNRVDAAIARVNPAELSPFVEFVGMPAGVRSGNLLHPGSQVFKVGRTTAVTHGIVEAVNVQGWITYPPELGGAGSAFFENQIVTTAMAGFGDSGSLLFDQERSAVGLLFGGSATHTFYNDITEVERLLEIEIPVRRPAAGF